MRSGERRVSSSDSAHLRVEARIGEGIGGKLVAENALDDALGVGNGVQGMDEFQPFRFLSSPYRWMNSLCTRFTMPRRSSYRRTNICERSRFSRRSRTM